MSAMEIVAELADAFGDGTDALRDRIKQRLYAGHRRGDLCAVPSRNTARYAQEAIHRWVSNAYPEVRGNLSYDVPQNVAIQIGGEGATAIPGDLSQEVMPDHAEELKRLVRDLRRDAVESKKAALARKEAISKRKAADGRKGGRGNVATD
jgi:hypothetical protein